MTDHAALFLNQNLSAAELQAILERRLAHEEKLIGEVLETAQRHPEIAEEHLRFIADMPLMPTTVRCFASISLAAVQARRQHAEAKARMARFLRPEVAHG